MLTAITDNAKTSALIPHLMTNRRPSGELRRYPITAGCHCRTAPRVLAWSFLPGLHGLCMAASVAGVECAMVPRVSLWRIVLCGVFPATRTPYNRRLLRTRACRLDCSAVGVFLVKYCQLVVSSIDRVCTYLEVCYECNFSVSTNPTEYTIPAGRIVYELQSGDSLRIHTGYSNHSGGIQQFYVQHRNTHIHLRPSKPSNHPEP
jgi:hypothetical protein